MPLIYAEADARGEKGTGGGGFEADGGALAPMWPKRNGWPRSGCIGKAVVQQKLHGRLIVVRAELRKP